MINTLKQPTFHTREDFVLLGYCTKAIPGSPKLPFNGQVFLEARGADSSAPTFLLKYKQEPSPRSQHMHRVFDSLQNRVRWPRRPLWQLRAQATHTRNISMSCFHSASHSWQMYHGCSARSYPAT